MGHGARVVGLVGVLLGLLLLVALAGCRENAPGSDVPDSTMVAALTDLHLLDGRRELYGDSALHVDSLRQVLLSRHGLDSAAFADALDAYAADAPRLRGVYDSVIVRVNAALREANERADG